MKSEWKTYKLGEIYEVHNGLSKGRKFFGRGYPFLSFSTVFNHYFLPAHLNDLVESTDKERKSLSIRRGDVFVTRTSETYDELGMTSVALRDYPEATYNGFTKRLRPYREHLVIPEFIGYYLRTPHFRRKFEQISNVTTRASLNNGDLLNMEVSIPPLDIQRKIASILSALDDKIETNNAICRNLEEQAMALYKSRLIDSIPFERIEDSHEKTTGWRIGTVDDVVEFLDSRRVPLSKSQREKMEKKYPYYGATELMDYVDNYLFDGTFLLLGEDGTVQDENGYPILQYVWGKFWVNNHAHVLTGKGKWSIELLYLLFANTKVSSVVTGAVQPKISQNRLKTMPVVIPPNPILENLSALITPLFAKRRQLSDENHRLANMRDTLLPTLMSGELEVETLV